MTSDGAYFPPGCACRSGAGGGGGAPSCTRGSRHRYLTTCELAALEFSATGATRWTRPFRVRPEAATAAADMVRPSTELENIPQALAATRELIDGDSSRVELVVGVFFVVRAALPQMLPFIHAAASGRSHYNGVVLGSVVYMLLRRVFPALPEAGQKAKAPSAASVMPSASANAAAAAAGPGPPGAAADAAGGGPGPVAPPGPGPTAAPASGGAAAATAAAAAAAATPAAAAGATAGAAATALRVLSRRAIGGGGAGGGGGEGDSKEGGARFVQKPCANACGRVGYFMPCSKCGTVRYCSAACKEAHAGVHAPLCVARSGRTAAVAAGESMHANLLAGVAAKRLAAKRTAARARKPSARHAARAVATEDGGWMVRRRAQLRRAGA